MVPAGSSYIVHLKLYGNRTVAAGMEKLHGLRHSYAQQRYETSNGWLAQAAGGRKSGGLPEQETKLDKFARLRWWAGHEEGWPTSFSHATRRRPVVSEYFRRYRYLYHPLQLLRLERQLPRGIRTH